MMRIPHGRSRVSVFLCFHILLSFTLAQRRVGLQGMFLSGSRLIGMTVVRIPAK
jgi:hypothetical protein